MTVMRQDAREDKWEFADKLTNLLGFHKKLQSFIRYVGNPTYTKTGTLTKGSITNKSLNNIRVIGKKVI